MFGNTNSGIRSLGFIREASLKSRKSPVIVKGSAICPCSRKADKSNYPALFG